MNLVERVKFRIKELIEIKRISIYELAEKSDLTEAAFAIGIQSEIIPLA